MASKHHPTYEDFEPPVEQSEEEGCIILTIYIPGFNKEEIKVEVSSKRKLRISGERALKNSKHKMQRFHKEFEIPSNCITAKISAKYKGGILHVREPLQDQPKQQAHNPILEEDETKQTNLGSNHNTDTPIINNNKFTIPTRRRLKEVIPLVFLKLILPPLALLLFWYIAKMLTPSSLSKFENLNIADCRF